jgi:ferredoxin-type protein NapH
MPDGLPVPTYGGYYPRGKTVTCILWEMQAYIYPFWDAGHGWGVDYNAAGIVRLVVLFGLLILLSVILGKVFCGWVCPFGLYRDLLTRLRKALRIKHRDYSEGFKDRFHQIGYLISALSIILSVVFGSQAIAGTQLVPRTEQGGFIYQYFSAHSAKSVQ